MVRLAVSIGCPSGIGPEVSVVAAAQAPKGTLVLLVGDHDVIARAAKARGVSLERIAVWQPTDDACRA